MLYDKRTVSVEKVLAIFKKGKFYHIANFQTLVAGIFEFEYL